MNVIGGILLFVAGIVTGGGAIAYNHSSIQRATRPLIRENEDLREQLWKRYSDNAAKKAYTEGYDKGRRSPISAVEELAATLDRHNASVKVRKE